MIQPVIDLLPSLELPSVLQPGRLDCRVLVVDDRRDVRHISQHFLEKAGASVTTAEDGQEGVEVALAARETGKSYDVIVMDMQMPKVDGLQAIAMLRSADVQGPIIALTADAMKGDRKRCINGGCEDYLAKPIDHGALVEMVRKYAHEVSVEQLQQRRTQRASDSQNQREQV